jgi:mono/diheme cytochrome c family protein
MPLGTRPVVLLLALAAPLAGCGFAPGASPGERLWRKHCADCHGLDGAGNTPRYMGNPYADLRDDAWRTAGDRGSIEQVVREGVFGQMPANDKLTAEELRRVIDYLFELRGERG